jgi:hypothetical protein
MSMATITHSGVNYNFRLKQVNKNCVTLMCNDWNIIDITSDGLRRCGSVMLNASFMDKTEHKIKWRTKHCHMKEFASKGSDDVILKLDASSKDTMYINCVHSSGEHRVHIGYIDSEGLYLWIDDRHEHNAYPMSRDRVPMVIDE